MSQKNSSNLAAKLEKLEAILAWFESEEITIEEGLEKYEQALKLSKGIEAELEMAKNKVAVLNKKFSA